MLKLFNHFLTHLGSPKEQKTESIALVVVYSMTLSLIMVMVTVMVLCNNFWSGGDRLLPPVLKQPYSQNR